MLTLAARFQEIPPDNKGGHDLQSTDRVFTGETYEAALTQAQEAAPEGWRLVAISVDR